MRNIDRLVLDTSALIGCLDWLEENGDNYKLIIPTTCVQELDNMKESENRKRAYMGRKGLRFLDANVDKVEYVISDICVGLPSDFDLNLNDNKILSCAVELKASLLTRDRGLKIKAVSLGVECVSLEGETENENNYKGYKIFEWDCMNEEVANLLTSLVEDDSLNIFNLKINEFAVLKDTSRPLFDEDGIKDDFEIQAVMQWTGEKTISLKYKEINNAFIGKVKPRNLEQKMLMSLLQNDDIGIVLASGDYGVGKDLLCLSQAVDLLNKNKVDKILWLRNPVNAKGVAELGFLKGDFFEKMSPYSSALDDILGGRYGTDMFIASGKLEIGNLGAIRGRTFKNTLIYLTEMQNCPVEIIQLIISRLGEGSRLFANGDFHQVDDVTHSGSTIETVIDVLGDRVEFGNVELKHIERSKLASLAKLFDK